MDKSNCNDFILYNRHRDLIKLIVRSECAITKVAFAIVKLGKLFIHIDSLSLNCKSD